MGKEHDVKILKQHLKIFARKLKCGNKWVSQMDKDEYSCTLLQETYRIPKTFDLNPAVKKAILGALL